MARMYLDGLDRARLRSGADVLAENGYTEAAKAVRSLNATAEPARYGAALRELRRVQEAVLRSAGLTSDTVGAIPSINGVPGEQVSPSMMRIEGL